LLERAGQWYVSRPARATNESFGQLYSILVFSFYYYQDI